MKKKGLIILLLLSFSFILYKCKPIDNPDKKEWDLPLNHSLKIGFNDTNLLFEKVSKKYIETNYKVYIKDMIYYIDSLGEKQYDQFSFLSFIWNHNQSELDYPYYFLNIGGTAVPISVLSSKGIKTWFIEWPNGGTDTLYADYYEDSKGPNSCMCSFPLRELKLNGKPYAYKTNYDINGVYVFD